MENKIKILIVDDISINRQILRALFDEEYDIQEADDGVSALEVLAEHEVDIIILDIIMPRMNGLEFLQIIKQNPKYKNISVIISTEAGGTENEFRALELGADNFVAKPYNPNIIKHRVRNLADTYISKRVALEKSLRDEERKIRLMVDAMPGGVAVVRKTDKYRITFANDRLLQMLGYQVTDSRLNADAFSHLYVDDKEKVRKTLEEDAIVGKSVKHTARLLCSDGGIIETELNIKMALLEDGTKLYCVVVMNITKAKEKEEILKKELHRYQTRVKMDSLTGIYNHETFLTETAQLILRHPKEQFVIGEWNIDRFKAVNELFGSRSGDKIICAFAEYLKKTYTWLCTFGRKEADHFVTCCTESFLEEHAKEIEALLNGQLSWHTLNYPISLHVGFYRVEQSEKDIALMCDRAGMALQQIKDSYIQREKYFNAELRETLVKEQQMMRDVETALQEKQFFVMYQPIIDVKTEEIIAAEALVRWRKPDGTIVPPGDFIPTFERNGFISKLDMYVWEEVCKYQSERKKAGKAIVPVSVNLSRIDFYNSSLLEDIHGLLLQYELDTDCLKLEITESAYMDQPQELMSTIQQFQKNGFKILMDDFGSGFSSLNMLKDVSVDILKIDMRFMENLDISERAGNILFSIIQMAKAIHMEVIAEGVETSNQYELLVSMDCDGVQGYYFYKPMEKEEFSRQLDEKTRVKSLRKETEPSSILVVDDVKLEREMLTAILGDEYIIHSAAGVDEAVEMLKNHFPNICLVISDIVMPKKDGFELLRQMKELLFLHDIPVLMVTAYGEYEAVKKAFSLGALDVVTKPYDTVLFRQRVKNILRITEQEELKQEIYTLRENAAKRKRIDSFGNNSYAGMARVKVSYENPHMIKEITYINNRFLYFNRMTMKEALEKKTLFELMQNVPPSHRRSFEQTLNQAVQKKTEVINRELRVEWDNGTFKNIFCTCTMQYETDGVILDIVALERSIGAEYRVDRMVQMLCEQLGAGIGLEIWRYYLLDDVVEYYRKSSDGGYARKIVRNGRNNTVNSPTFLDKDRDRLRDIYDRIYAGEKLVQEEFQVYSPHDDTGALRWLLLSMIRIDMPDEEDVWLGISRDITAEKNNQERKWREQQYKEIFTKDAEFFTEADLTENRFISEESLKQFTRYHGQADTSYDAMLELLLETVSGEDMQRCRSMLLRKKLLEWYENGEREVKFDFLSEKANTGTFEWYTSTMFLVKNSEDSHVYASWQIKNVQREKQRMHNMERLAERDNLTGLYNRSMLERSMDMTLASFNRMNKMSAFFMIDIDNFKTVNDTFGHDVGDSVLKAIANMLIKIFRREDIVARLGGDEFAIFIPRATSKEWVCKRAQEICDNSYIELENQGRGIHVSCSVGIVFGGENGVSFKALYPKADKALYQAKKNGKNCFEIYDNSLA